MDMQYQIEEKMMRSYGVSITDKLSINPSISINKDQIRQYTNNNILTIGGP